MTSLGVSGDTETTPGIIERLCNQVSSSLYNPVNVQISMISPAKIAAFHCPSPGERTDTFVTKARIRDLIMTLILIVLTPDELAR